VRFLQICRGGRGFRYAVIMLGWFLRIRRCTCNTVIPFSRRPAACRISLRESVSQSCIKVFRRWSRLAGVASLYGGSCSRLSEASALFPKEEINPLPRRVLFRSLSFTYTSLTYNFLLTYSLEIVTLSFHCLPATLCLLSSPLFSLARRALFAS